MGCCLSRTEGPNSPYPGGATSSARAINTQAPTAPSSSAAEDPVQSPTSPGPPRLRARNNQHPLDQHIDKPLRRHVWTSRSRVPWTRRRLDSERIDFFDTRVTGRPEVWQTLRAALEVLWEADRATGDDQEARALALATAQTIVSAADITLPTGDLAQGAYDALGNYYSLPEHIVCDPSNLSPDDDDDLNAAASDDVKAALGTGKEAGEGDEADDDDEEEAERRREEKGKAVLNLENLVTIKARLSETGQDVTLQVSKDDTIRSIARKIIAEAQLSPTSRIRIAYLGKIIKETGTLLAANWQEGHVLNAFVFESQQSRRLPTPERPAAGGIARSVAQAFGNPYIHQVEAQRLSSMYQFYGWAG